MEALQKTEQQQFTPRMVPLFFSTQTRVLSAARDGFKLYCINTHVFNKQEGALLCTRNISNMTKDSVLIEVLDEPQNTQEKYFKCQIN